MPAFDPTLIIMVVVLGALIFVMFRNSKKRKAEQETLRSKIVPGVDVMTNFGLFGTIKSIDEAASTAELEIAPGTVIRVHSQTLAKVVDPDAAVAGEPRSVEEAMAIANAEQAAREAAEAVEDDEPKYGERVESDDAATEADAEKSSKKPGTSSSDA